MSIQTELTRLTNAKTAIQTAIEGKGVTVPSGTLLDGMAALIESIEAGESNIVVGSFTLTEDLTQDSPLNIDITFPKNEFPLMYCVFEDTSERENSDISHTTSRTRYIIAALTYAYSYIPYSVIASYNTAGSLVMKYAHQVNSHYNGGYASAGGVQGTMDVSLENNQIRFATLADGVSTYLVGRTYRYILYWGD